MQEWEQVRVREQVQAQVAAAWPVAEEVIVVQLPVVVQAVARVLAMQALDWWRRSQ